MTTAPKVFISATSGDLATARKAAIEAILVLGCLPDEQAHFAPDSRKLTEMLQAKVKQCDALLHIVGFRYGAEPETRGPGELRRSYTQMEYDAAEALKKRIFLFMLEEGYPFDVPPGGPEDEVRRQLQLAHREALKRSGRVYSVIATEAALREKLRELPIKLDWLRWLSKALTIALVAVIALLCFTQVQAHLEWKKIQVQVADLNRRLEGAPATPERYDKALDEVKAETGVDPQQLAQNVAFFERRIHADAGASPAQREQAVQIGRFAMFNTLKAAPGAADLTAAQKYIDKLEAERKERQRNSFSDGLGGPIRFVTGFIQKALSPHEYSPRGDRSIFSALQTDRVIQETEEAKYAQGTPATPASVPGAAPLPPETPGSVVITRSPVRLEDYVYKPGEKREPTEDTGVFSVARWQSALSRSWDETWGVGPGLYRVGFVCGTLLILGFILVKLNGSAAPARVPVRPASVTPEGGSPPAASGS